MDKSLKNTIRDISLFNKITLILSILLFIYFSMSMSTYDKLHTYKISTMLDIIISAGIAYNMISKKIKTLEWIFMLLAIMLWFITDFIMVFFINQEIQENPYTQFFYSTPSICIFLAAITIFIKCFSDIKSTQMVADILVVTLACISLIIFVFLDKNSHNENVNMRLLFDEFYIMLNFFILCIPFIIHSCVTNIKQNRPIYILNISIGFFAMYDIASSLITKYYNIGYQIIFILVLIGSFYTKNSQYKFKFIATQEKLNKNLIYKSLLLLLVPAITQLYVGETSIGEISFMILLMLFYIILSFHISSTTYKNLSLKKDRQLNTKLNNQIRQKIKELNNTNKKLTRISKFDGLTTALNKPYFLTKLSELIKSKSLNECVSVYNIDINYFKVYNDMYGQHVGDLILIATINRIKAVLSKKDIVGRFGSDDIFIAATEKKRKLDHDDFVDQILKQIQKSLDIQGKIISLVAKVGISSTQTSQIKADDLISQATMALNTAKENISLNYTIYNESMNKFSWEDYHIVMLLDSINFYDEFKIHYQPQYDIKTKQLVGAEALLRWYSPKKGFIPPNKFIHIAEQGPSIIKIGKWVNKNAIKQISKWNKKYGTNLTVHINVSTKQIDSVNFAKEVLESVQSCIDKNNNNWIGVEITESNWMDAEDTLKEVINIFIKNNISVSLDDFGTGFSSLSYLKDFNLSKLKIAKELIDNIQTSESSKQVVIAIITLAKNLKIKTIAEGVEYQEQLEILQDLGCDEIQGYLWGKPMSASEFENLIVESNIKN